jgi:hypothetical protein
VDRQNRLITIFAFVLLALVAIVIYGKDPDKPADPDSHEPPDHKLFDGLNKDDVTTLTLKSAGGEIDFAKKDGEWHMTAPKEIPIEERKVTEIIDRVTTLEAQDRKLTGSSEAYGLDAAKRAEITLGKADNSTVTLFVGADAPVGYRTYVAQTDGGPTLLASSQIHELASRGTDDFRSKAVWKVSAGTAKRIRIDDGGRSVVLRKDDHGWWVGDEGPRASDSAVEDWLSKADYIRSTSFLDGQDPAALGIAGSTTSLTVEDADGTHILKLGTRDDSGANAQGSDGPVRVGTDALELVKLDGWADTHLMPVRRATVDAIEIQLGDKTARYTKKDDAWTDADGKAVTSAETVFDALDKATGERGVTPPAPTEPAWGHITLSEGTNRKESVLLGPAGADGKHSAKDAAGGPPFAVPQSAIDAIVASLTPLPPSPDAAAPIPVPDAPSPGDASSSSSPTP